MKKTPHLRGEKAAAGLDVPLTPATQPLVWERLQRCSQGLTRLEVDLLKLRWGTEDQLPKSAAGAAYLLDLDLDVIWGAETKALQKLGLADPYRAHREMIHDCVCKEAWAKTRGWKVGDTLYCCSRAIRLGSDLPDIHFGDALVITAIEPRARRVWCSKPGGRPHQFEFETGGLVAYALKKTPPAERYPS
jgi:hypothetical protein